MPSLRTHIPILALLWMLAALLLSGCGDPRSNASFDDVTGKHSGSWTKQHGESFVADATACAECHGDDLQGGISGITCFAQSFDGTACHGAGAFHGALWADPDLHGEGAKALPDRYAGFQACQVCHGSDYSGGLMQIGCYSAQCHVQDIPHSPAPWNGENASRMHMNTNWQNADVCAICHAGQSPTPAPAGTPPSCMNNTLCHGPVEHDDSWVTDHAVPARSDNTSCAAAACHGSDYRGGSVGVGCYDCHLGGPDDSARIMHPNLWSDPKERHDGYLEDRNKDATSCAPSWPGVAQYCHGDGLPRDPNLLSAPPNGSWSAAPTCYACHDERKWDTP